MDLYNATSDKKDGDSMENALGEMIDKTEKKYKCIVAGLGTDNDGGSKAGRVKLGKIRTWLLTFPCCGHQVGFLHFSYRNLVIFKISLLGTSECCGLLQD